MPLRFRRREAEPVPCVGTSPPGSRRIRGSHPDRCAHRYRLNPHPSRLQRIARGDHRRCRSQAARHIGEFHAAIVSFVLSNVSSVGLRSVSSAPTPCARNVALAICMASRNWQLVSSTSSSRVDEDRRKYCCPKTTCAIYCRSARRDVRASRSAVVAGKQLTAGNARIGVQRAPTIRT